MQKKNYILIILLITSIIVVSFFSCLYIKAYFIEPLVLQKPILYNKKDKIPAVLYKTGPHHDPPPDIQKLFKKIKLDNPKYKIIYYNDQQARDFIKNNFSKDILNAYDNLIPGSYKADLFRYCILYKNGGIYGDLSQTYLVPLRQLVNRNNDILVLIRDRLISSFPKIFKHGIQISFMAAQPKLPIFLRVIDKIVENVKTKNYGTNPVDVTGPCLFRRILDKEDIPYRIELELNRDYIENINTGQKVIKTKLKNHDKLIKKTSKNAYHEAWYKKKIFKN